MEVERDWQEMYGLEESKEFSRSTAWKDLNQVAALLGNDEANYLFLSRTGRSKTGIGEKAISGNGTCCQATCSGVH